MGYARNIVHCNISEKNHVILLDCFQKQTAQNLAMQAGREACCNRRYERMSKWTLSLWTYIA